MIFVDTNCFLRFLLKEVDTQHRTAVQLFRDGAAGKTKLVTSVIVFFEIYWVLESFYVKQKEEIIKVLEGVLKMEFVALKERPILKSAIQVFAANNIDLEDAFNLVYAWALEVNDFKTFDKKLDKLFSARD